MTLMKNFTNYNGESIQLKMLGIGLIRFSENSISDKFDIVFQKGIGIPLIHNIIELYKTEILNNRQGNSIIPVKDFTIHLNYFQSREDIIVLLFMDEKEDTLSYSQLYLFTKSIRNSFRLDAPISEIISLLNNGVSVPRTDGVIAVLVIGSSGSPLVSKVNVERSKIEKFEVQIGGFISALFSFSKEIIGDDSGAELKEINFGNQRFYMITKMNVIFAFLIEKIDPIIRRYMYIIVDEFLEKYKEFLINFDGYVSRFEEFEKTINQYFII